jgi:hypothetical protein
MCAAIRFLALATIFSLTMTKAPPLMVAEREPPVPMPKATLSVSPWMYFTSLGIDAEAIHQHLLEHGGVALAVRDGACDEGHSARRVEADLGGFEGRIAACSMVLEMPDAAQLAAPRRLLAPLLEAAPVGERHGHVHVLLETPLS